MHNRHTIVRFNNLIQKSTNLKIKLTLKNKLHFIYSLFLLPALFLYIVSSGNAATLPNPYAESPISIKKYISTDTIPITDRTGDFINDKNNNPFDITPSNLEQKVEYDMESGQYIIYEKIGDEYYRTPTYMTFDEYMNWKAKEQEKEYFQNLAGIQSSSKYNKRGLSGKLDPMSKIDISKSLIDRLFGGTEVNVKPQGGVDLTLGFFTYYKTANISAVGNNFSPWNFLDPVDFKPRLTVDGNVGSKIKLNFNYDANSTFDFDRKIKLQYDSEAFSEDDIIKKIEAGNVSFPLKGNLIQGAQSLTGLKTDLQFGHLRLSLLASQQLSKQNKTRIENGAEVTEFSLTPDQYDENRHFFLSHFNRNNYEGALVNLPQINTSYRIAQIEVYISDDRPDYQNGQTLVAAISDMAEGDSSKYINRRQVNNFWPVDKNLIANKYLLAADTTLLPDNRVNGWYEELITNDSLESIEFASSLLRGKYGLRQGTDFEVFRGRLLNQSEYTYHPQLGFISLNGRLRPNQNLAVAYKYYYTINCDSVYSVGQMSQSGVKTSDPRSNEQQEEAEPPKVIFAKLLKSSNQQVSLPNWDLMMKNVYNLNTSSVNREGFEFDVFYEDDFSDGSLKKYIPEDKYKYSPLLNVFNLDRLNKVGDPQADGIFDYVPGVTVIERAGSVVFPVLEPFGSSLKSLFKDDTASIKKYVYQSLYDTTLAIARIDLAKSKFRMVGKVKSTNSGEINLGPFVPRDGVKVSAGGITLLEGVDYEIDYTLGKLRILNPAYLSQGTPIDVNYEDQSAFSALNRSMFGVRVDYDVSKKFTVGATFLKLKERPFTQKVNFGDDPISNKMYGIDFSYSNEAPWITRLLDKLPFYSTKAESSFNLAAEAAYLKPGHASYINSSADKDDQGGLIHVDDFEGAVSGLSLGTNLSAWTLASTPDTFPEGKLSNDLRNGANRARLSWYQLDQSVGGASSSSSNPFTRLLSQTELFNRQVQPGFNQLFTFDVSYYPTERGPYNFDIPDGYPGLTQGTEIAGNKIRLKDPASRWGGMMRYFQNSDFETNNYQFIEFWLLNPFLDSLGNPVNDTTAGKIKFHLGNVSEDIIKDNFQFYENALPKDSTQKVALRNTEYGVVPLSIPLVTGFELDNLGAQDLGLDGLNNNGERAKFSQYINQYYPTIRDELLKDPSGDDYIFYDDKSLEGQDLLSRLKHFCNPQGNTPTQSNFDQDQFYRGSRIPDSEDLDNDKSLDQGEGYYEYEMTIKNLGGELDTASTRYYKQYREVKPGEKWYRFVIPITEFTDKTNIEGFRAIQFMRMMFTNFSKQQTFRMAEFQIVRNQWRISPTQCFADNGKPIPVSLDEVGIEENSSRLPFNYVSPRGIKQEQINNSFGTAFRQDEKSLVVNFCELGDSCEVQINKVTKLDMTLFKKIQMFTHLEPFDPSDSIPYGDLALVLKLGKDLTNNYYEYEIPLQSSVLKDGVNFEGNIWPDTNYINLELEKFLSLKKENIKNKSTFEAEDPDNPGAFIRVRGTPSLAYIKVLGIAVRNKSDQNRVYCGQVWVNELRLAGLNESGSYAAQARGQIKLADLGDINFAGSYNSKGFGAIDQRLMERSQDATLQYDASTSLQVGKVLPKALKLTVPFFAQITKSVKTPRFDPYQGDLTTRELVEIDPANKDDYETRAKETTTIKSFNFTNVKREGGKGGKPWSPENVSATYSYTQTEKTDPVIESDLTTEKKTTIDYGYAGKPKYIQPLKFLKPKALKIFSEFNFNFLPTRFGFNTSLERYKNIRRFRLPDQPVFQFDDQRYRWDRNYTLDWDFTKGLRFNFKANVTSVIDEYRQVGIADDPADRPWVDEFNNPVQGDVTEQRVSDYKNENFRKLGRSKNYNHNVGLNYKIPINLLPMMDWITASADYKSSYTWTAGALIKIDEVVQPDGSVGHFLGNVIQNTQNRSVNATFAFDKLYQKWGYLKKIESGNATKGNQSKSKKKNDQGSLGSDDKDAKTDVAAKPDEKDNKDRKNKERSISTFERILIRPLLTLRQIKFTYKEDLGTSIPGFMPESKLLGLSDGFEAPGWQFAAGLQPNLEKNNQRNFLFSNQAWFNKSPNFNDLITQTERHNINAKIGLEPFKDFKVDVDFNKDYRNNHTEIFKYKDDKGMFMQIARLDGGSFEATYASFNTLFSNSTELFNQMKANRLIVSENLPNITQDTHAIYSDFRQGYGPGSFAVVVPAFLAAYRGEDINNVKLDLRSDIKNYKYIPRPNWSLRYDGLSKLKPFKKFLTNFSLRHAYKATIAVNNFYTNPDYTENDQYKVNSENGNYYSQIEIPFVSTREDFSPMLGIDLKTTGGIDIKFEYKKGRNLELRPGTNGELAETQNEALVFGFGYTINNFKGFGIGGKKTKKKRAKKPVDEFSTDPKDDEDKKTAADPDKDNSKGSGTAAGGGKRGKDKNKSSGPAALTADAKGRKLTINCDFSFRDEYTQIWYLTAAAGSESQGKSRGQRAIQFNPTVEYQMYKNLALRFYFDYNFTHPYNPLNSYDNTNMGSGVVVRYTFN